MRISPRGEETTANVTGLQILKEGEDKTAAMHYPQPTLVVSSSFLTIAFMLADLELEVALA